MTKERTLVLLKPDAVQRNLIGTIISRFERVGLKLIALKLLRPTKDMAYKHYVKNEEEIEALGKRSIEGKRKGGAVVDDDPRTLGQSIVDRLVVFLSGAPIVAFVLEGHQAIRITRKIVGSTEPLQSDVGTIRGDFTVDSYEIADAHDRAVRNLVHASANEFDSSYEIGVWFSPDELLDYENPRETVLYK